MTQHSELFWRSADGLSLHARDYPGGDRLPVICIHGLTRNARDFEDLAPAIAASGRRVLAVDIRGRGASDPDPQPMNYHPGTYAADILSLMDDQGLERAIFIGTSMGGLITMALAALRPDAIAAAVLNDVGPEVAAEGLARIGGYLGVSADVEDWEGAARYAATTNAHAFPDYGPADWAAFARRIFRQDSDGRPVLDYDPAIATPIRAASANAAPPDLWPLFGALMGARPGLLVRGETSDILSADVAARMRAAAPDMTYREVSGVGHAPMLTESQALDAIMAFLANID